MNKIVIISGAGISSESGISTFRGNNGLWENHKIEEVANYLTWKQNFDLVHKFYNERRAKLKEVEPNYGHYFFTSLTNKYKVQHFTQNVDDLLERSGHPKEDSPNSPLIHLHGFLTEMHCEDCGYIWNVGYNKFDGGDDQCPNCPSKMAIKPNVVFFNQSAPMYAYLWDALDSIEENDIIIIAGTMGNVLPIEPMLRPLNCKKILNNLEPNISINDDIFDLVLYKPLTKAVPEMEDFIETHFGF